MHPTCPQNVIQLKKQDIHIWNITVNQNNDKEDQLAACRQLLSRDEKARVDRLHSLALRHHATLTKGYLRNVLGEYLNQHPKKVVFTYNQYGKPELEGPSSAINFNVSHCQNQFLIALTLKRKIGVDIECTGRFENWMEIAKHSLSQREQDELFKLVKHKQELAFIRGWTRKEAYTKALGLGLLHDFSEFSVSLDNSHPEILNDPKTPQDLSTWKLMNINVDPPYFASLAADCGDLGSESPDLVYY